VLDGRKDLPDVVAKALDEKKKQSW
jgi:hypothetical protein